MDIEGKRILVLGGYGFVGSAVCRRLAIYQPEEIIISSLRKEQAKAAVEAMKVDFPDDSIQFLPAWGDILLRSDWQGRPADRHPRIELLSHAEQRRRFVADILEELDEDILESSLLYQQITGKSAGSAGRPADVVID